MRVHTIHNLSTTKKIAIASALAALGFVGNYLALPMAYSVEFIFGSIFSIIAIGLLGTWWGVGVAIVASSCTVIFWNHPYALIIFTLEALWIGLAIRSGRSFLVLIDAAYWLCLGWLLVAFFYGGVMGLDFQSTAIIVLKQAINGIFNALVGSLLLHHLPFSRFTVTAGRVTYQKLVFHSACGFLMFPALSLLLYMNYQENAAVRMRVAKLVQTESHMLAGEFESVLKNHINAVSFVADFGNRLTMSPSEHLQGELEAVHKLFPAFSGIALADADAVTVAAYPSVNLRGTSNIGISYADRDYYKQVAQTGKTVISDALLGKHSVLEPLFIVAVPFFNGGTLSHFAIGSISSKNLLELIQYQGGQEDLVITLIDGKGKVIVSTDKNREPLKPLVNQVGQTVQVTPDVLLWVPGTKRHTGIMQAWKGAFFLSSKTVEGTDWTIRVEHPLGLMQQQFYSNAIRGLAGLALLFLPMLGVAFVISKYLTRPLEALATITADLPSRIYENKDIDWPQSNIAEVAVLVENFQMTSEAIEREIGGLNSRIALAADTAKIGVWEYLVPESKLIWDKWMYALYGIREEDFSGAYQAWQNGLHPDDKELGQIAINQALRGEKNFDIEFRVVWPTGEVRHLKADGLVQRDANGNPLRMIGTNYDITELKLAEKEKEESKDSLRTILNSTAEGIYGIDMNGCCIFCNQAGIDMLGYDSVNELLGRNMHDQVHHTLPDGSSYPLDQCEIFKTYHLGQSSHVDDEFLWCKDGSSFPCEYWSYPQYKNREIVGAVVTFFDITKRKQAEEALLIERRRLTGIIEGTNSGTWEWNVQTGETIYNDRWAEIVGYRLEELSPTTIETWKKFAHPDDFKISRVLLGKHFSGELEYYEFDSRMKHKNGHWVWVLDRGRVTSWTDDGEPLLMQGTHQDISERKAVEEALYSTMKSCEAANQAKSEFLATMSHEIRTPMNGVIGMTGLLLDTELTDEQRGYTEIVKKSGENLLGLINDILDFSKIEAGKLDMEILDFDLRVTLEDTADMLAGRAGEAGLEMICQVEPDVPIYLKGDPGRLRQIITNFAGNSIKFTRQGEVVIRASLKSDQDGFVEVLFEIIDTGIGIPESRLAAVFEPFTQADGSVTRKFGGTGLGLTICKQLAELMGGEVGVASEDGKGSTFWFTAKFEKQTSVEVEKNLCLWADITGARILVVDDNDTNCTMMTALLKSLGCRFASAGGGIEAIKLLQDAVGQKDPFRIALIDQMMPGIDGFELGRRIKDDSLL